MTHLTFLLQNGFTASAIEKGDPVLLSQSEAGYFGIDGHLSFKDANGKRDPRRLIDNVSVEGDPLVQPVAVRWGTDVGLVDEVLRGISA